MALSPRPVPSPFATCTASETRAPGPIRRAKRPPRAIAEESRDPISMISIRFQKLAQIKIRHPCTRTALQHLSSTPGSVLVSVRWERALVKQKRARGRRGTGRSPVAAGGAPSVRRDSAYPAIARIIGPSAGSAWGGGRSASCRSAGALRTCRPARSGLPEGGWGGRLVWVKGFVRGAGTWVRRLGGFAGRSFLLCTRGGAA